MRLATAAAVTVSALLLPAARAAATSGLVGTRFDSGVSWFLDKPPADEPLYPGFHGSLSADGKVYRRLRLEVAGSIDSYRYGPEQIRSALFIVRGGPMFVPVDFDGGTGWIEATAGYARLHGRDCLTLAGGLGYMAQYGRLGLGLFSRYTQVVVPAGWGHGIKVLTIGISAGVAVVGVPQSQPDEPSDSDGDGVEDAKDHCPGTRTGARVDGEGCEAKPSETTPNTKPPARSSVLHDEVGEDAPLSLDGAKAIETPAPAATVDTASDDGDQDGVLNAADQCPETSNGFPVDVTGCPVLRARFTLPQVSFMPFTARPRKEALAQLDELARVLRERPGARVRITAYVENAKDKPLRVLQRLAKQRATVVAELLAARGIAPKRMRATGSNKPDIDEIEFAIGGSTKRRSRARIQDAPIGIRHSP